MIGTRQGGVFISPVSFAFVNSLGQTIVGSDKVIFSWFDILCRLNFEHNASIIVPFLVEERFFYGLVAFVCSVKTVKFQAI